MIYFGLTIFRRYLSNALTCCRLPFRHLRGDQVSCHTSRRFSRQEKVTKRRNGYKQDLGFHPVKWRVISISEQPNEWLQRYAACQRGSLRIAHRVPVRCKRISHPSKCLSMRSDDPCPSAYLLDPGRTYAQVRR